MEAPREPVESERVDVVELVPRALEPDSKTPPRALAKDRGAAGGDAIRAEAEGIVRTCLSMFAVRATEAEATVDEPLAAIADEVGADATDAAGLAFTLLFTKRCSLAS
jgi:hypothetical protein